MSDRFFKGDKKLIIFADDRRCRSLPFHVYSAGTDHAQEPVRRPNGYFTHHIFCVEKGTCLFETESGNSVLEEGAVVFIQKDYPLNYQKVGEKLLTGFVTFDGIGVEGLLNFYCAEPFLYVKSPELQGMVKECCRYVQRNATPDFLSQKLYELLIRFFSQTRSSVESDSLKRAKNFIATHFQSDLSVEEIATAVGISQSLLFLLFRTEELCTPMEFLRHTRIRHAKQILLQNPNVAISDLAVQCGFSDCSYFCKVFKAETELTPKEFSALYALYAL